MYLEIDYQLSQEIFAMSLYMALRPFEFTALGFFSVDFSLTYGVRLSNFFVFCFVLFFLLFL